MRHLRANSWEFIRNSLKNSFWGILPLDSSDSLLLRNYYFYLSIHFLRCFTTIHDSSERFIRDFWIFITEDSWYSWSRILYCLQTNSWGNSPSGCRRMSREFQPFERMPGILDAIPEFPFPWLSLNQTVMCRDSSTSSTVQSESKNNRFGWRESIGIHAEGVVADSLKRLVVTGAVANVTVGQSQAVVEHLITRAVWPTIKTKFRIKISNHFRLASNISFWFQSSPTICSKWSMLG